MSNDGSNDASSDESVFLDDGAISLTFGSRRAREAAMKVRDSAKWSRDVQTALQMGASALKRLQAATDPAEIAAIAEEASKMAGLNRLCDLIIAHGVPAEIVEDGTAAQCMAAFGELYRLENPQMALTVKKETPTASTNGALR